MADTEWVPGPEGRHLLQVKHYDIAPELGHYSDHIDGKPWIKFTFFEKYSISGVRQDIKAVASFFVKVQTEEERLTINELMVACRDPETAPTVSQNFWDHLRERKKEWEEEQIKSHYHDIRLESLALSEKCRYDQSTMMGMARRRFDDAINGREREPEVPDHLLNMAVGGVQEQFDLIDALLARR